MDGWVDRLAEHLEEEPLSQEGTSRLLDASRAVAHRVERKTTPLAAYLLGVAAGRRMAQGESPEAAMGQVLELLTQVLPPVPAEG